MMPLLKVIVFLTIILTVFITGLPVSAQSGRKEITKEHLNKAYETVFITRTSRAYNEIIPKLALQAQRQLTAKKPGLKKEIEAAIHAVSIELVDRQGELDQLIARSWAERFSVEELREISLFFSTPTGAKLAKMNTELIAIGLDLARQWGSKMGLEMVNRVKAKLKSQGYDIK